jgi:thioredoxin
VELPLALGESERCEAEGRSVAHGIGVVEARVTASGEGVGSEKSVHGPAGKVSPPTTWCGPCRLIAPIVDELARDMAGRMRVVKLNVDENPRTAARFGLRSIPTLLVLKAGRELDRIVGAVPKHEITRRLDQALGGQWAR